MQVLVVGAGVVGLACARAAALAGHEVIVAEAADAIGTGTSSRNSEVIHAGLYYPTGSETRLALHPLAPDALRLLRLCTACLHRNAASSSSPPTTTKSRGSRACSSRPRLNEVEGVDLDRRRAAKRLEPELACLVAMRSPETGIPDSHAFMHALRGDLEDHGGVIAFNTPIERLVFAREPVGRCSLAAPSRAKFRSMPWSTQPSPARSASAMLPKAIPQQRVPRLVLAKGNYFGFAGRPAFSRLVYPVPIAGGLGGHVTLDMSGRMRFGPDVQWIAQGELRSRRQPPPRRSTTVSAITFRACPITRWCRTIAASDRSSPRRASQPPSSDRGPRRITVCPASSISLESNRRG